MLEKYEVTIRNRITGNHWSLFYQADDFSHAEEQTLDTLGPLDEDEEIISITKDYSNV